MKEFSRFQDLFRTSQDTKKYSGKLMDDALAWYKSAFNAVFSSLINNSDVKGDHLYAYSAGLLIFYDRKSGGAYHYRWIIARLHFRHWKTAAYLNGYRYFMRIGGRASQNKNHYSENDFINHIAWQCGFTDGIHTYYKRRKK